MLSALLRTASVTTLMLMAACEFSSAPSIGQSSGGKKKGDAGSEAETKRKVVVAKPTPESDAAADAESGERDASAEPAAKAGAGGKAATTKSTAGRGGAKADGDKDAADKDQDEQPEDEQKPDDQNTDPPADKPADKMDAGPADAGAIPTIPDAGMGDAAARPTVDNPTGVLEGLARRSTGARTAATITRFLETIATGDAPAPSIKEFLETINEEMMCEMNPFATECLAACQAVSTTCWVCVLDEGCRASLLDICGYAALAGCVPRR